jgi:hypothetical protein
MKIKTADEIRRFRLVAGQGPESGLSGHIGNRR